MVADIEHRTDARAVISVYGDQAGAFADARIAALESDTARQARWRKIRNEIDRLTEGAVKSTPEIL